MKRIISLFLAVTLIFSLTACGGTDSGTTGGSTSTPKQLEYPFGVTNRPMEVGLTYPYKTLCYQDTNEETSGYVTIIEYTVTPAEEEGYVNKTVKAKIVFNDDNAYWFGTQSRVLFSDFGTPDTGLLDSSNDDWTVEADGKTGKVTVITDQFNSQGWNNRVYTTIYELSLCMPEWYDGIALFFYNAKNAMGIGSEDGELPDGTPIRDLLDSDTQWIILGSEDQKYYGSDYEKQFSDIELKEPEPAPPLLEPEYGNEPPVPEEEYYDDEDFTEYIYVDIDDWNVYTLNRNEETTLEIHYSTYNVYEDFYVVARAYLDDMDTPVFEQKLEAYNPYSTVYSGTVTFTVKPEDIADADLLSMEFSLYDSEDFELSGAGMNVPIE